MSSWAMLALPRARPQSLSVHSCSTAPQMDTNSLLRLRDRTRLKMLHVSD